jgi:hypothetical protein
MQKIGGGTLCSGIGVAYRRGVDGGALVQPTVGQFEAKPRSSMMQATTDSPR